MTHPRRRPRLARNRRGFALIAALWLLVALSAIGLEFSLQARARRLSAANVLEEARARAAAEAGLEHLRARLAGNARETPAGSGAWQPAHPGVRATPARSLLSDTIEMGDARYFASVRDAASRLNLNLATEDELRRFFRALRVDYGRSDVIAQSILDWRDADSFRRGRGAERAQYLEAGALVLPPDGRFTTIRELRDVQGVTPETFDLAAPFLTIAGSGQVNLNAAERPVLLALPGMTETAVEALIRVRLSGRRVSTLEELVDLLPAGARWELTQSLPNLLPRVSFEARELEAVSEGWVEGGRVRVQAGGTFVRAGRDVFLVGKWVR